MHRTVWIIFDHPRPFCRETSHHMDARQFLEGISANCSLADTLVLPLPLHAALAIAVLPQDKNLFWVIIEFSNNVNYGCLRGQMICWPAFVYTYTLGHHLGLNKIIEDDTAPQLVPSDRAPLQLRTADSPPGPVWPLCLVKYFVYKSLGWRIHY